MDLLYIAQISCIKCHTSMNQLTINDQDHNEVICERCLENQTKKYIYLNLEIQNYQRNIKEIKQYCTQHQKKYNQKLNQLEETLSEDNISTVQYNQMSQQLNEVQLQMKKENQQFQRLQLQLLQIEQQQRKQLKKYHLQIIRMAKVQQRIAEKQSFVRDLERRQKQIKQFSQSFDFNHKH